VDSHRYIITFARTKLPPMIKLAEWHREIVEVYIPTPMRCIKCQLLGHTKKNCSKQIEYCSKCAQEGHRFSNCTNEPFCVNCSGKHPSSDRNCDHYKFRCEVLATQAREHVTYREALDRTKETYRDQNKTFSFVTGRQQREVPMNNGENNQEVTSLQQQLLQLTTPLQDQASHQTLTTQQPKTSTQQQKTSTQQQKTSTQHQQTSSLKQHQQTSSSKQQQRASTSMQQRQMSTLTQHTAKQQQKLTPTQQQKNQQASTSKQLQTTRSASPKINTTEEEVEMEIEPAANSTPMMLPRTLETNLEKNNYSSKPSEKNDRTQTRWDKDTNGEEVVYPTGSWANQQIERGQKRRTDPVPVDINKKQNLENDENKDTKYLHETPTSVGGNHKPQPFKEPHLEGAGYQRKKTNNSSSK